MGLTIREVYDIPVDRSAPAMTQPEVLTLNCGTQGGDAEAAGPSLDLATGLIQLTRMVQGVQACVSERHDLTPVQAKLLCVLLEGPRGMAELAQLFGVAKAALTGLMDRAEGRGLAQRCAVPGDRRALQVTLTDAGRRTAIAFHAEVTAELDRLAAPLAPDRSEHFRATLAEIIQSHRARPASDRPSVCQDPTRS